MSSKLFVVLIAAIAFCFYAYLNSTESSVVFLALNYLARPHLTRDAEFKYKEIVSESAWIGKELVKNSSAWIDPLSDEDKNAFYNAILHFQSLNESMIKLRTFNFPLPPQTIAKIGIWKEQLGPNGRGFQVIRGVPIHQWTMEQCEIFFFALGKYLGITGAQDIEGNLLGHVRDIGPSDKVERPYKQRVDIAYHCDGSDVVGLLCIHPSKSGGSSKIVSSVAVFNQLLKHPKGQQYVHRLFDKIWLFTRSTFGVSPFLPVHPLRMDAQGTLRTYWNQEYYVKSYKHIENNTLTDLGLEDPFALEAIEAYDSILDDAMSGKNGLGLVMDLRGGDIQLLSNHYILHARTEFEDYTPAEIQEINRDCPLGVVPLVGQRDLLRLWVSESYKDMTWTQVVAKQWNLLGVVGSLAKGIWKYRL